MRIAYPTITAVFIAGALAGCERESTTVVTPPAAPVASPAPSSSTYDSTTTSTTTTVATPAAGTGVVSTTVDYTQSMERLQQSAQRLRDSILALSQQAPGPQRNQAIASAHQALRDTNQAMVQLPPEMRVDSVGTTSSAGATGSTGSIGAQPDNPQSLESLQKAAQRLRESIQSMAKESVGERRNQAIKEAHQALYDTNQAMIQLPAGAK